jgi:hypothetical protein
LNQLGFSQPAFRQPARQFELEQMIAGRLVSNRPVVASGSPLTEASGVGSFKTSLVFLCSWL